MLCRIIRTACVLFVGCCVGVITVVICEHYDKLKSSFWEFRLIELIRLITYSLIAVYVAYHLRNRFSERQMKKNCFLAIANDLGELLEEKLADFQRFMRSTSEEQETRVGVMLTLRQMNNKIYILEKYKDAFSRDVASLVDTIRADYDQIKQTMTGDEFTSPSKFSEDHINRVTKGACDIVFSLDKVKLGIF